MGRAKPIMIQGTMSNAGKSLLAAGLCRVLSQDGLRVAPFKSQNMALNSGVTADGLEMGRAQIMQAEACGIAPDVRMNPILLKPESDHRSQLIVAGKAQGAFAARDYFARKKALMPQILEAFDSLAEENDVIVIEGAGSPVEINLAENDIVNMGLARAVSSPVLLAGDIDPGGVFAQLYGTVALFAPEDRALLRGLVVNKFRGDVELLRPGLAPLEKMCGVPVVGVVPYLTLDLDDEDSLAPRLSAREARGVIDVAVVRLPHLSNFTDFDPLSRVPGVGVRYVSSTTDLGRPDLVVLPGSKTTLDDARWLAASGIGACVRALSGAGTPVLGICGGYQLLGDELSDPHGREGAGTARGLGLIPASTVFKEEKRLAQSELRITGAQGAFSVWNGMTARGYEIHDGETTVSCAHAGTIGGPRALARAHARPARERRGCCGRGVRGRSPCARVRPPGRRRARSARHGVCLPHYRGGRMIHVYHGDGKGKTTAAMGLALRMLAAGRRVVVVQFLKDGESGEARLLAEHFGVPVFAGKVSDKFTWSMSSEELAATCELHDGNLASALAELEGAQEGLLVLDEALDALSKGLVDEALVDRALDMSARGVEVALTGRAPSRKIVEKADYITEMRCEKHPYKQGICAREGVEY